MGGRAGRWVPACLPGRGGWWVGGVAACPRPSHPYQPPGCNLVTLAASALLPSLVCVTCAAFNLFVKEKLEEFKAQGVKPPEVKEEEGGKKPRNPMFTWVGRQSWGEVGLAGSGT